MLTTLLVIVCLILILTVTWVISYFDLKRRRRDFVREKFGRMPKIREWNDTVRNYYDVVNDGTGIDSVTWNDLSLNDVFRRINSCDCSAGEEILYWRLRRNRRAASPQVKASTGIFSYFSPLLRFTRPVLGALHIQDAQISKMLTAFFIILAAGRQSRLSQTFIAKRLAYRK